MSGGTTSGTGIQGSAIPPSPTLPSTVLPDTGSAQDRERWAALDQRNERVVDFSHPLLAELRQEHPDLVQRLQAAS